MRVLDLFSGIGGFSLGLERAGMKTVAFCEIDPFCRKVLRKHWPDVPIFEDVRTLTAADVPGVDVICGGFPCQDISNAGKRAGIDGERSGLWSEYARLIGEIRPQYVIVENVAALLGRGLDRVLGDLAALGFDAEWHCIPASYVGAPHRRDRVWIVAYPRSAGRGEGVLCQQGNDGKEVGEGWAVEFAESSEASALVAYAEKLQRNGGRVHAGSDCKGERQVPESGDGRAAANVAHAGGIRSAARVPGSIEGEERNAGILDDDCLQGRWFEQWRIEPNVGRVANGVPSRVDRLKSLGNAVVPQIPEIIGRAILQCESFAP